MNQILHIFSDEKWTNSIVKQFINTQIADQKYVVLVENDINELKYELDSNLPLIKIDINSKKYDNLLFDLESYSSVFIHYLCEIKFEIIENISKHTKLVWMCWGQDIHKMIIANSYMPQTRRLLLKNGLKQEYFWKYTLWLRQLKFPYTRRGKLLKRFDYCCPVIFSDLDETNKKLKQKIQYLPFHYSTLQQLLGNSINDQSTGTNILIGNSSSYASNHLDVFEILSQINFGDRNIIVPLNYGDMKYGNQLEAIGKNLFGEKFMALRSFLESKEYTSIIKSCSIAIFNHIRQQALGNILICLWFGIRVYLNDKGSLFGYLQGLKLPVYSIQLDLTIRNEMIFNPLSSELLKETRVILLAEFGDENTNKLTQNVLENLNSLHS